MFVVRGIDKLLNFILRMLNKMDFLNPVLFKIIFEIAYIEKFSYFYDYLGSHYTPNLHKMWLSWIPIFLFCILRNKLRKNKLSQCFNLFFFLSAIPSFSIYWLKDENDYAFVMIVLYWLIWWGVTFIINLHNSIYKNTVKSNFFLPKAGNIIFDFVFVLVGVSTFFFSYIYGDFRVFIPFEDVYNYRLASGNSMGLWAYIFMLNSNLFLPIYLCVHFIRRNYVFLIIDILLLLLSYGIYGNKAIFFSLFLIIGILILRKFQILKYIDVMALFFMSVLLIMVVLMPKDQTNMFIALVDRIINGPPAGHYNYFDFFSKLDHPYLFLRESILRFFLTSPYDEITSIIIGSSSDYYSGRYNNMTNGLWSVAYANFGVIGVLLQPILIVLTLNLNLQIIKEYDDAVQYIMISLHVLYLIGASYFSWLISGGLLFEMCFLYFVKQNNNKVLMITLGHFHIYINKSKIFNLVKIT